MLQKYRFEIVGTSTLRTHNGQLADPLNPAVIQIKAITRKGKKKTEDDEREARMLEARGGMYVRPDGEIYFPGANIKTSIKDAGKRVKQGRLVEDGVQVPDNLKITYSGPTDPGERARDPRYVDSRIASINPSTGAKGVRTRPIFDDWKIEGVIEFDDELIDAASIKSHLEFAAFRGLAEHHGGFGRFDVTVFEPI